MRANVESHAAIVVSSLALFVALGGTSFAVMAKINGASLKNRSVSGEKLERHTVDAAELDVAKLPEVPSARQAATATRAQTAINAINAANASASSNQQATLLSDFDGLTLECAGPSGTAGTVDFTIPNSSSTVGEFGFGAIPASGSQTYTRGVVQAAVNGAPRRR